MTGGARGIGGATAIRLAESGRDIVIADMLDAEAAITVAKIEALGQRAVYIKTNVADETSVRVLVDQTLAILGRLDILVCCAGIFGEETPFLEITSDSFERFWRTNVMGVHYAHQAIPYMLKQGWGRCVTITSGARLGATHNLPYGVTKGRFGHLFRHLATPIPSKGCLSTEWSRGVR